MSSRYREESLGASIVLDSEHVYTHFCGVPLEPDDHICIYLREGSVHKNTVSPRSLTGSRDGKVSGAKEREISGRAEGCGLEIPW